jgi:predicted RecB family nuclease
MRVREGTTTLSATDLANHLSCRHLTALNLRLAKGEIKEPSWDDPHLRVLQQRGLEHEKSYIESLRSKGVEIVDLSTGTEESAGAATFEAMSDGAQAIFQAGLADGDWRGRADVLLRVERPSCLGGWSYEVVDCKLSRETKAETILQLCLYSELVTDLQGWKPEFFHIIRPHVSFQPESYRFSGYAAYYRVIKTALQDAVKTGSSKTYPEPVSHCDICRWWKECDNQWRRDDHLSLVAGASGLQRKELALQGIFSLESLANLAIPISFNPSRGGREGYARIREQARIQLEARTVGLKSELLLLEPDKGLFRLPSPSIGDIFLDLEGDPFVGEGGLEYLFGLVTTNDEGHLVYQSRWALTRAQERIAFEWFIDLTFERIERFPDLHIYHYASYEPGAVKRLMLRYATREEEVDRLLRGKVFVDLHSITKQSVRASVEQYSLKEMEKFCKYQRKVPLPEANKARHFIEHQLEMSPTPMLTDLAQGIVERYNQDDCQATERLRDWLESLRSAEISTGVQIPRPQFKDASPSEKVTDRQLRVAELFEALTKGLPAEPANRTPEQAARWLLAHALDWHRREDKVQWWEFFRMKDLSEEDLYDEKTAIADLSFCQRMPKRSPRERAPVDQYHYPIQECSIRPGDTLYTFDEKEFGEVVAADPGARTINVKKPVKLDGLHPSSVFSHSRFPTDQQSYSILRLADWIVANGIDSPGDYRAVRDLLLRKPPRFTAGQSLTLGRNETPLQAACRTGLALDSSVLPIQGPPGAGKTFTGAHMICELANEGKKVGITAVSHKVIRKLLDEVLDAARRMKVAEVNCAHRKNDADPDSKSVQEIGTDEEALQSLQSGAVNILGGTPWQWCKEKFRDSVHVLFVDEAGQMSLANVLACAPAGRNLALLGDPQQLEQPQQGSHPEGSDISALAHLLDGRRTITQGQGIFLAETWRLHPAICSFTSELFYEGRLASQKGLQQQNIQTAAPFFGAGLWFAPVSHEGNQSYSAEEVDRVVEITEILTRAGSTWTDQGGNQRPLTMNDILIVAPYNNQVNRLTDRLPYAKVGTVDKFQGQEAAVVIYSMTTSTSQDAPRGMEFLYNLNRFNVATSRARCACIVVGSPRLFSPECRTPRQMELANVLCRYAEMSHIVGL